MFFCIFAFAIMTIVVIFAYMNLHVFNPEHDIALAAGIAPFTAPHAGRQLRADLGFLPALWANDGDFVLVDDVEAALESVRHVRQYAADVCFLSAADLHSLMNKTEIRFDRVMPWGWDKAVCHQLRKLGLCDGLPDDGQLSRIRRMSNRRWAAEHLLPSLVALDDRLLGESHSVDSVQALHSFPFGGRRVLKAPWSSSGRGVRYELNPDHWKRNEAWACNVVSRQGNLMVEPYYNKVEDFGMEFRACPDGSVAYMGLSLFRTQNGAYSGSVVATEDAKRKMLSRYVPEELLDMLQEHICRCMEGLMENFYEGPFGVDMMVVAENGKLYVHPCVELNLRHTMGHVSLALPCDEAMPQRLMRITYTDKYHFRISDTNENVINNSLI